jgi:hypothetical protein
VPSNVLTSSSGAANITVVHHHSGPAVASIVAGTLVPLGVIFVAVLICMVRKHRKRPIESERSLSPQIGSPPLAPSPPVRQPTEQEILSPPIPQKSPFRPPSSPIRPATRPDPISPAVLEVMLTMSAPGAAGGPVAVGRENYSPSIASSLVEENLHQRSRKRNHREHTKSPDHGQNTSSLPSMGELGEGEPETIGTLLGSPSRRRFYEKALAHNLPVQDLSRSSLRISEASPHNMARPRKNSLTPNPLHIHKPSNSDTTSYGFYGRNTPYVTNLEYQNDLPEPDLQEVELNRTTQASRRNAIRTVLSDTTHLAPREIPGVAIRKIFEDSDNDIGSISSSRIIQNRDMTLRYLEGRPGRPTSSIYSADFRVAPPQPVSQRAIDGVMEERKMV